jgi:hypothetical protein
MIDDLDQHSIIAIFVWQILAILAATLGTLSVHELGEKFLALEEAKIPGHLKHNINYFQLLSKLFLSFGVATFILSIFGISAVLKKWKNFLLLSAFVLSIFCIQTLCAVIYAFLEKDILLKGLKEAYRAIFDGRADMDIGILLYHFHKTVRIAFII